MTTLEYIKSFELYRMTVFYFCKKQIAHQEAAEDITANVFLKLWENVSDVELGKSKAFIMVTANRMCHDYFKLKKHYNERVMKFSTQDFEHAEIESEVIDYLHKLLDELHPREKEILQLRYFHNKSQKEIGHLLSISPQTAANTISNGLKHLRYKIKNP